MVVVYTNEYANLVIRVRVEVLPCTVKVGKSDEVVSFKENILETSFDDVFIKKLSLFPVHPGT